MQHAITFKPKYLFFILPNGNWNFVGYEIVQSKQLEPDSFYDPLSGKKYREIFTTFYVLRRAVSLIQNHIESRLPKTPGITVTRKWPPNTKTFVVIRRVGRNTTKQFYCVWGKVPSQCTYLYNGRMEDGAEFQHAVETDYFLKVCFQEDKTKEEMILLCDNIRSNPEPGYDRKNPHAITNSYVWKMIAEWLQTLK